MQNQGGEPEPRASGGCQCGAVRYVIGGSRDDWDCNLCHCRMCQKASGGPFMVFINVSSAAVTWTRGTRATFASSSIATRAFCRDCGTPLTYERRPERISITHGTLDDPTIAIPTSRLVGDTVFPWSETVGTLPGDSLSDWLASLPIPMEPHQHPDHET